MQPPIDPQATMVHFNRLLPGVGDLIRGANFASLPSVGGRSAADALPLLTAEFDGSDFRGLLSSPPSMVFELLAMIHRVFASSADSYGTIFQSFPPYIADRGSAPATLILYLVALVSRSAQPLVFLQWLRTCGVPRDWHNSSSATNSVLTQVSMMKQRQRFTWAYRDVDDFFCMEQCDAPNDLRVIARAKVRSVKVSGKSVRVVLDDGTSRSFAPPEPSVWESRQPFPLSLTGLEAPFPKAVLVAFYEALTADDMAVVRALCHFGVVNVKEGVGLMGALLDVFAYAGKMDQFLVTIVGLEFSKDELQATTVLRTNCHLTNLLKAFFSRYGRPYFDLCLSKIIDYVLQAGDISLSHLETADVERAEKLLFTVLRFIINSPPVIPNELRHLGAILKSQAIIMFNNKQATYNTLNGYICLRFITAVIADPVLFRPGSEEFSPELMRILMPFSQLLQTPVNLAPLDERFEIFSAWNPRLVKHIWPKLIQFVFSVADCREKPNYPPPQDFEVMKALSTVLGLLSANFQKFKQEFNKVTDEAAGQFHPIGWSLAAFIAGFFEEAV
jgi:hypothetical protein